MGQPYCFVGTCGAHKTIFKFVQALIGYWYFFFSDLTNFRLSFENW